MGTPLQPGVLCWLRFLNDRPGFEWLRYNHGRPVEIVRYRGIELFIGGLYLESYDVKSVADLHGVVPGNPAREIIVHAGERLRAPRPALIPFSDPGLFDETGQAALAGKPKVNHV
jgi:hypothetical protein